MGNQSNKSNINYNLKQIIEYKGNEDEFKILNEKLDKPFKHELIFKDEQKTKLKYMGQLKDDKYNGRGILYDEYTYDGYFKDGIKNGYFRIYQNNSKKLIYQGFLKDSKYHGKGILYDNSGNKKYEGNFNESKYYGIGIEYFRKGISKRKMVYDGFPLKECFGELYDEKSNLIYQGLLKNFKPEKGKDIAIYDEERYLAYIGDFSNFEYIGKGILYYTKTNMIFFDGIFDMGLFSKGSLYDPKGEKIYEGEFIKGQPKEIKNIKLYELNGNIKFIGDLSEGKYQGFGKLYENNRLIYQGNFKDGFYEGNGILYIDEDTKYEGLFKEGKYNDMGKIYKYKYLYFEGEFKEGKKNGKGIIYYEKKQKYFEGNFENDERKGQGIKYYDNGSVKIEANYINSLQCKGKYYSPDKELLFEGEMNDEIPCSNKNIKIYNDYTYKIYTLEKKNYHYITICSEYSPEFFMSEKLKGEIIFKIPFFSFYSYTGKSALIHRLSRGKYVEILLSTIGLDYDIYRFKKNNFVYKGTFWDFSSQARTRSIAQNYARKANIAIFTINFYSNYDIEDNFINNIKDNMDYNVMIYLVGNKFEDQLDNSKFEEQRNKAKKLIEENMINKYFEVDVKRGEVIDNLIRNIEFDILAFCKRKEIPDNKFKKKKKK